MLFKTKETYEQETRPLTLKTVSNCIGKLLGTITVLSIFIVSSCSGYDDSEIRNGLSDLENRVSKLETLCSQMNSNIDALQTIVNALQQKESIESVTPLSDGQGYTLTFSSGKTVTIYNGKDGKDGKDGVDGRDGSTPSIGISQHSDGNWYWTVNGDWLYDTGGNMVKAVGTDGDNGNDGTDGKDGKDGVTPEMKIENGMWYVSCDGGVSWELLGKATGADGDSFFKDVWQDSEYPFRRTHSRGFQRAPAHDRFADSAFDFVFNKRFRICRQLCRECRSPGWSYKYRRPRIL